MFKKFFSVTALLSVVAVQAATNTVTPTVVLRSQSFNGARLNAGMVNELNKYDMDEFYWTLSFTPFYQRSFRSKDLAQCLFGDDLVSSKTGTKSCDDSCGSRTINIQGSTVANRSSNAWLADYFYLPSDFNGTISFDPTIQNAGVDLQFYAGLDEWINGVYFRMWAPINWTKWDLNFKENVGTAGTANYPAGVFTPDVLPNANLLKSFGAYAQGDTPSTPATPNNVTRNPLCNAQIRCDSDSKTQLADLRAELGWNFFNEEDYHLGFNVQVAAPTGNKRKGQQVFQAVVGNGNKWELGGGVSGHYVFWRSEDEEKHFGFYVDAMVTHLFSSTENRTFDLKGTNKGNSRYMLAERLGTPVINGLSGAPNAGPALAGGTVTAASAQFKNEFTPVANLTTFDVDVSIGAQGSVTAWFNYTTGGLGFDLGYEFYGRSCEKIKQDDDCRPAGLDGRTWALKGDSRVFGFAGADSDPIEATDPVALSATQNQATIRTGRNALQPTTALENQRNFGVDNAQFAGANGTADPANRVRLLHQPIANNDANQTKTSIQPVFISLSDVTCDNGETKGISNKIWAHLNWEWDREGWVPYLGIGGSAEFGKTESSNSDCSTSSCSTTSSTCSTNSCDSCIDCTVSQWELWFKGGLSF